MLMATKVSYFCFNKLKQKFLVSSCFARASEKGAYASLLKEREKNLHFETKLQTCVLAPSQKEILTKAVSERENLIKTKFSTIKVNLKEVNNLKQNFKEMLTDNSLLTKKEEKLNKKSFPTEKASPAEGRQYLRFDKRSFPSEKGAYASLIPNETKDSNTASREARDLNLSLKDLTNKATGSGASLKEFVSNDLNPISKKENFKNIEKKQILTEYHLESFHRSNQDTSLLRKPLVSEGDWVQAGEILTDCSASVGGELSLGQNLLIAYMPWEGYNYEDAILISERLVSDDLYTSVHIERYDIQIKETKLGIEEITRSIPDVSSHELKHLDSNGIAKIGSWIQEGDILVGKISPINKKSQSPYQKLLYTILEKQFIPIRDSSLRAPKGIKAKVIDIKVFYSEKRSKISQRFDKKSKKESLAKKKISCNTQNFVNLRSALLSKRTKNGPEHFLNTDQNLVSRTDLEKNNIQFKSRLFPRFALRSAIQKSAKSRFARVSEKPNKFVLLKFKEVSRGAREKSPRQFYGKLFYSLFNNYLAKHRNKKKKLRVPAFLAKRRKDNFKSRFIRRFANCLPLADGTVLNYFTLLKNQNYLKKNLSFNQFIQKILNSINLSLYATKKQKLKKVLAPILGTQGKKKKVRQIRALIFRLKRNLGKNSFSYGKECLRFDKRAKRRKRKVAPTPGYFSSQNLKQSSILNKQIIRVSNTISAGSLFKRSNYCLSLARDGAYASLAKFQNSEASEKDLKLSSPKFSLRFANSAKCRKKQFFVPTLRYKNKESLLTISQNNKNYKKHNKGKALATKLIRKNSFLRFAKCVCRRQTGTKKNSNILVPNNPTLRYNLSSSNKHFPTLRYKKLNPANISSIAIYLAEKRKVQVGDKMAGRHGNKGIISQILPREDMPYLPNGTPIDMVLNPLGVPSRMNVGQIYECLLGLAGKFLGENYKIFPFDEIYGAEASRSFVFNRLNMARMRTGFQWLFNPNTPGKMRIYDGRTGDTYDQPVTVGIAYMLRLVHMVDDKIHMRSTGPYSLVTQQPLRGRSKQGGQRLGEMEVWALEGYGAAFTLLEMLTIKSDDMTGRMTLWSNLILNKPISIGTPESFKVLVCELQALCLDVGILRYNPSKLATFNSNKQNVEIYRSDLIEITNLMNLP